MPDTQLLESAEMYGTLTPRQEELADTVLVLMARDGLPGVSFRTVAAESGWSLGAVQKAFPTKEAMLEAAFGRLRESAAPLGSTEPGRPTLIAWLEALMIALLPLDEARMASQRQGDAFAQYALTAPDIAQAIAASDAEVRGLVAALIGRARVEGEVAETVKPDAAAWAILALLQGVATQLLYDPMPEDAVREKLTAALTLLLPHP